MNKICRLGFCFLFPMLGIIFIFFLAIPVNADQDEEYQQCPGRSEPTEFANNIDNHYLERVDHEFSRSEEFLTDPVTTDHQPEKDEPDAAENVDPSFRNAFNNPGDELSTDSGISIDLADPEPEPDSSGQADILQPGIIDSLPSNQFQSDDPVSSTGEPLPLDFSIAESSLTMQKIDDFWIIETFDHLNHIHAALTDKYRLLNDLEIPENTNWNPIGQFHDNPFSGTFDGSGFAISGLVINNNLPYAGFFGYIKNAGIMDLHLRDIDIDAGSKGYVGGLVGRADKSAIERCSVEGTITSSGNNLGGLVGYLHDSVVDESYAHCNIVGTKTAISIGGLVGFAGDKNRIINSYSSGSVSGNEYVGGLAGYLGGDRSNPDNFSRITDCYSVVVIESQGVRHGGLLGDNHSTAQCINSFWDKDVSGQLNSALGTGKPTSNMKSQANFSNWDFANTWHIEEGVSYPGFRWQFDNNSPDPDDPGEPGDNPEEGGGAENEGAGVPGDDHNGYPSEPSTFVNAGLSLKLDQAESVNTASLFFKLLSMISQVDKLIALMQETTGYRSADILKEINLLIAEITELLEANRFLLSLAEEKMVLDKLGSITAALAAQ